MHRRSFLATGVGTAFAVALTQALTDARLAAAAPLEVTAHPRLLLHDFSGVKALIAADARAAAWYGRVKDAADRMLTLPVGQYVIPDGKRLLDTSRETLNRVYALGFAHGVEGGTTYRDRLWAELAAVCAFPDWNHQRHFLDVAEMTHAVALGYDWFHAEWSAAQRTTLETGIKNFGLLKGIDSYNGNGSSKWHTVTNNWNIVCNGGMIVGALALADVEPELAQDVITRALASLPMAIAEYAPDGGYPEGLGSYWGYATKYLVLLIEALATATGTDHGLSDSPGVATTGDFPIHLTGPNGSNFNYYDAGNSTPRPPEMFWLARRYRRAEYGWLGGQGADSDPISWTQAPTSLLWYDKTLDSDPIQAGTSFDSYFGLCEVATMRSGWLDTGATFVGAKGGHNDANHGNLDLGDFVLDANGERWAAELGGDDYNLPGYFSTGANGQRWTYYRNRTEGQNTLVFNPGIGPEQPYAAVGTIERRATGIQGALVVADLTQAHASLSSWRRGWRLFDQRRQVVVQDEFTATQPVEAWWFLHTSATIEISADGRTATLTRGVQRLAARITSPGDATFLNADPRPLWTSPDPAGQNANAGVRKLTIRLRGVTSTRLTVQFSPLHPDQQVPEVEPVTALSAWGTGPSKVSTLSAITLDGKPLEHFAANNFHYVQGFSTPVRVTATPSSGQGRAIVHLPNQNGDGSVRITVTAPGAAASTYRIWPKVEIGPGHFASTIVASTDDGNIPANTMDGSLTTRWSASGAGQWIGYDMGSDGPVSQVRIAWYSGAARRSIFAIQVAGANQTEWREVFNGMSSGTTNDFETYSFPATTARYLRIVGQGNTSNAWNSIAEVSITGRTVTLSAVAPYLAKLTATVTGAGVGRTVPIAVTGTMNDGSTADLSGLAVEYVSTAPDIATVDQQGQLTGVAVGTTTVAAIVVTGDHRLVYARTEVQVTDPLRPRLTATADAFVNDGANADRNYGTTTGLTVKTDRKADSGFNRQAFLTFSGAPITGTILGASLFVYGKVQDNNGTEIDLTACEGGAFDEKTITWNNRPALGATLGSAHLTSEPGWWEIPLGTAVAAAVAAGQPVHLALAELLPTGTNGLAIQLTSRESTTPPYLQVTLQG